MSGQSKWHSFLESMTGIIVGYSIAVAAQLAIFPVFNINIPLSDNLLIGAFFTVVSLIRSYALRRIFNAWHVYQQQAALDKLTRESEKLGLYKSDRW